VRRASVTIYSPDRRKSLAASATALVGLLLPLDATPSQDLTGLSLMRASQLLRNRAASSVQLTQACLDRIDKYNATLNAFITVTAVQALTTAREMDGAWRRGSWRGPLHGIPIALKDNMDTAWNSNDRGQ
jgi:aspartyl-tRNA(Asn)/glutamyl-tRNA(Gln) amidotransferase subunit A